jgi:hypothetical protein
MDIMLIEKFRKVRYPEFREAERGAVMLLSSKSSSPSFNL